VYCRKYQIVGLHSWEHRLAGVLSLTVKHTHDVHHHSRVEVDLDGAHTTFIVCFIIKNLKCQSACAHHLNRPQLYCDVVHRACASPSMIKPQLNDASMNVSLQFDICDNTHCCLGRCCQIWQVHYISMDEHEYNCSAV
jgi:hypothetical protein